MNLLRDTEPWHGIEQLSLLQANIMHDAVKLELKWLISCQLLR